MKRTNGHVMKYFLERILFVVAFVVSTHAFAGTIQGTVFEDYNYGGGAGRVYAAVSGMALVSGATVELYNATSGAFIRSETTNLSGSYAFGDATPAADASLPAGNYYVRVVSSTVRSTRTGGSTCTTCIPVQTFRRSNATTNDLTRVGGERPDLADAGVASSGTTMTAAGVLSGTITGQAQSVTTINVATNTTNVTGVSFGFNFSTVVNKNDAGQGSLRQFIINSNALSNATPALAQAGSSITTRGVTSALPAGKETTIFMISDGTAKAGLRVGLTNQLTGGVAVIQVASLLPALSDSDTTIDGGTQTFNIGNSNTVTLGTGGSVGTGGVRTVNQLNGPELQLEPTTPSSLATGLGVSGANFILQNMAIKGFGVTGTDSDVLINAVAATNTTQIRWNVIGTTATSFALPTNPTVRYGVYSNEESLQIQENLVGFVGMGGLELFNTTSATLVEANEVRNSGRVNSRAENINLGSGSSAVVRGNLLTSSDGPGIDTVSSTGSNLIEYNTISNNGRNSFGQVDPQTSGIRLNGSNNTVRFNIISQNNGAGVLVRFSTANTGNLISQNSIFANGTIGTTPTKQLGIDLTGATTQDDTGTTPFTTTNDANDSDTGPNNLLNFPIFESITISGSNLLLTGCAPTGATIELFEADVSPGKSSTPGANTNAPRTLDYGEGETYLTTLTEGVSDTDTGTGCAATDGNDQTGMARFAFSIPTPTGVVSGDRLTATATVANNTSEFSPAPSVSTLDYGDAPVSYGTPSHSNTAQNVYLGSIAPDGDSGHAYNGTVSSTTATDDDTNDGTVTAGSATDDEDSVASFPTLNAIPAQTYTVSVNATNASGSNAFLVGYIDFNRDGDFDDAGERSTTVTVPSSATNPQTLSVVFTTPTAITFGATYARFRIGSTQTQVESPTLAATGGEVEDFSLTIVATDYGDAPDTAAGTAIGNYRTLASDNGPSHTLVTGLAIGGGVDGDLGTAQNAAADADDTTTTDDEDGVTTFPNLLTTSVAYSVDVNVTNSTGSDAYLVGFLDRNRDGDFLDANEFPATAITIPSSTTNPRTFTVTIPAGTSTAGTSYMRFRLSSTLAQATTSVGASTSGEVEDYRVAIGVDYGDAPDTGTGIGVGNYQTLASDGGPSHQIVTGLSLGTAIDSDSGALQNAAATSDDTTNTGSADDEEGVASFAALDSGATSYSVTVNATNTTGSNAFLVGYLDFNRDGDFADAGERSATVTVAASGSFTVNFTGLTGGSLGASYARFRLSQTQAQAESSIGASSSGEVEDYRINIGVDYGDAPDTGAGTATGNYQTLASDGGPSHQFVTGLALGTAFDSEAGTLQDATATADDTTGSDDEDAVTVFSTLTSASTTYSVTVSATNSTGANAFLVGYLDFNRDGDFLDTGERSATVTVGSNATNPRTFTLNFTGLTGGSAGASYMRFRISSTQAQAESSIGASSSGEVEDHAVTIDAPRFTELSITKTAPATVELGRTLTYTLQVANAGPDSSSSIVIADTLPSNYRSAQWTCAITTGTADCDTNAAGTGSSGTGNLALNNVQMNAGSSLTITITGIASTATALSNTATVRPPSGVSDTGYNPGTNAFSGNNTSTTTTTVTTPTWPTPTLPSLTTAGVCAVPGVSGDGTISGVINTYYGSASTNQTVSAGSTSVVLGASRGASTPIAAGDLVLLIQMQDATINTSNTSNYGGNNGTGSSYTSLDNTGLYEYVVATNSVPLAGGTLTFRGGGSGNGAVNTYTNADPSATRGQRTFQVIRVPQYANATLSGTVQAVKWNGSSGGVVVVDVAGTLTWSGTIDVELSGFRAGYAPAATSGNSSGTIYRCSLKTDCGAGKGEGVAGTPANLWDGTSAITTGSGYPDGTTFGADYGMGGPANGGGGGGFHNAGGGGGSNGGAGGKGGLGWEGQSTTNDGGEGGVPLPPAINRLFMGGGGGGGDANNAISGVRGGVGAGIVLVRAGRMTGTGTIEADGDIGDRGVYQSAPDGAGGGGAGGSVLLYAKTTSSVSVTVNARGGAGGNTEQDNNNEHGPGGGGGGGLVIHNVPGGTVTANVTGGVAGRANNGAGIVHGAQDGTPGHALTFTTSNDPFANGGDGSTCAPQLTVAKATTTPTRSSSDTTATYTITVTNAAGRGTGRGIAISDDLPAPFTYAGGAVTPVYAGGASGPASITGTGTDPVTFGTANGDNTNSFTLPAGGSVALTFTVNINSAGNGTYQNPATVSYTDPTSATATVSPGGTDSLGQSVTGSNYDSASSTNEDITIGTVLLGIAKALDRIVHSNNATDTLYTLVYRLTVENFGSVTLSNLEITDNVVSQFSGLSPTNFNTWVSTPANAALLSPAPTLTLNGSWNGTASSNVLSASQTLTAGQSKLVYISFDITVNPAAALPNNQLRDNSATARGTTPSSTVVTDTSTNGTDPDGTNNDNNPNESVVTPTPFVKLIKEVRNCGNSLASCSGAYALSATGKPGDYLEYRIRYINISSQTISALTVKDTLVTATPFQEDTYALLSPGVADFNLTCPDSSTLELDRSNAAIVTTPASGAITAFDLSVTTACGLTTVSPAQQGQVLFKVRIP